jgi:hypothetical protein
VDKIQQGPTAHPSTATTPLPYQFSPDFESPLALWGSVSIDLSCSCSRGFHGSEYLEFYEHVLIPLREKVYLGSNDVTVSDCKKKRKVSFKLFLSPLLLLFHSNYYFICRLGDWHTIASKSDCAVHSLKSGQLHTVDKNNHSTVVGMLCRLGALTHVVCVLSSTGSSGNGTPWHEIGCFNTFVFFVSVLCSHSHYELHTPQTPKPYSETNRLSHCLSSNTKSQVDPKGENPAKEPEPSSKGKGEATG